MKRMLFRWFMRYVVVEKQTNKIVNAIEWDGISPWEPPSGTYAVPNNTLDIGFIYVAD